MDECFYSQRPITSLESLKKTLNEDISELIALAETPDQEKYKKPKNPVFKKDGTERIVRSPVRQLRTIQYRINKNIFAKGMEWPSYLFGSIPKNPQEERSHDYVDAASVHCGAKSLCCLDISDFFDNIHESEVKNIFVGLLRFSEEVADLLTKLVTFNGHLVQGALTSSYLAMMILWNTEPKLVNTLHRKGVRYSRLVDDITLSSESYNYNFTFEMRLIEQVLHDKGLFYNVKKVKTSSVSSELMLVHGLNVTGSLPAMPRHEAKRIRASVKHLESLASQKDARSQLWYRREFNRCRGRVYKLDRFGKKKSFENLLKRLEEIVPEPSKKDISYAKIRVKKLEYDFKNPKKRDTYNYVRRFSIASHRVAFLKGYYNKEWMELRKRLKAIFPNYTK